MSEKKQKIYGVMGRGGKYCRKWTGSAKKCGCKDEWVKQILTGLSSKDRQSNQKEACSQFGRHLSRCYDRKTRRGGGSGKREQEKGGYEGGENSAESAERWRGKQRRDGHRVQSWLKGEQKKGGKNAMHWYICWVSLDRILQCAGTRASAWAQREPNGRKTKGEFSGVEWSGANREWFMLNVADAGEPGARVRSQAAILGAPSIHGSGLKPDWRTIRRWSLYPDLAMVVSVCSYFSSFLHITISFSPSHLILFTRQYSALLFLRRWRFSLGSKPSIFHYSYLFLLLFPPLLLFSCKSSQLTVKRDDRSMTPPMTYSLREYAGESMSRK